MTVRPLAVDWWQSDKKLWGYRIDDELVDVPSIPPMKTGISVIKTHRNETYCRQFPRGKINQPWQNRNAISSSLGMTLRGACPTFPDYSDHLSFLAGFYYRVARGTPIPDKVALRSITKFIRRDLQELNVQQMLSEDVSYPHWREDINFPESRKCEFDDAYDKLTRKCVDRKTYLKVKGFCKEEDYKGQFKYFRCINARSDYFKVDVGPFFRQLEKKIFCLPQFIKKIPNQLRAKYIMDNVYEEGGIYICTDYTSFESGFRKEVMEAIEFEVYHYVGRGHPEFKEFWEKIKVLKGKNRIQYKSFQADVPATRMSGEMNTSLGNGIFNLFAFRFACFVCGCKVKGVVEGDDGLNWVDKEPDPEIFKKLGMFIKYEKFNDIGDASFCGQVFEKNSLQVVRDPVQTMVKMGWSTRQYMNSRNVTKLALLRSRAMSGLYENPGCPILNVWNMKILELTERSDVKKKQIEIEEKERDTYVREQRKLEREFAAGKQFSEIFQEPTMGTRLLVEKRYGIQVGTQFFIESMIERITQLGEVDLPLMELYYTRENKAMYEAYRNSVEPVITSKVLNPSGRPNAAEDLFERRTDFHTVCTKAL